MKEHDRHFTATTFVVKDGKVLLIRHKKLGIWIPIGGHIELNELPEEAALREVKEEVGLDVVLVGDIDRSGDCKKTKALIKPNHILLEKIEPKHYHIDLVYFAKANGSKELSKKDGWIEARWFSKEDLKKEVIPQNVKHFGKLAIDRVKR